MFDPKRSPLTSFATDYLPPHVGLEPTTVQLIANGVQLSVVPARYCGPLRHVKRIGSCSNSSSPSSP